MSVLLAADPIMPNVPPEMLSGGVLAVLAWTIYYVLTKVFPAHERAQKDQRDAFLAHLEKQEKHND
jgi:hypothetical protein